MRIIRQYRRIQDDWWNNLKHGALSRDGMAYTRKVVGWDETIFPTKHYSWDTFLKHWFETNTSVGVRGDIGHTCRSHDIPCTPQDLEVRHRCHSQDIRCTAQDLNISHTCRTHKIRCTPHDLTSYAWQLWNTQPAGYKVLECSQNVLMTSTLRDYLECRYIYFWIFWF